MKHEFTISRVRFGWSISCSCDWSKYIGQTSADAKLEFATHLLQVILEKLDANEEPSWPSGTLEEQLEQVQQAISEQTNVNHYTRGPQP